MKKIILYFFILIMVFDLNYCRAQNPSYILRATNFDYAAPNIIDFDVYLEHTSPNIPLKLFAVQLSLNIDTLIANGGKLSVSISPAIEGDSSGLPRDMRIKNPVIALDNDGVTYLFTTTKISSASGEGLDLSNNGSPGTKLSRLRIMTTSEKFSDMPLAVEWRNTSINNTIIAVYNGTLLIDVSTPETHLIILEK